MARIRSVHPGQWTAGDFLECSPLARLLALALRNVADDNGVFRWKPKTIKAECLPADNCDIDALLAELVANEQVKRYTIDGKEYGLIVDFTQWQRPKKPKYVHPVPDWFSTSTEPVPNEDDTGAENFPQREEVGGRREEEGGEESQSVAVAPRPSAKFDEFWKAYPRREGPNPRKPAEQRFDVLVKTGLDPDFLIAEVRKFAGLDDTRKQIGTRFIPQAVTWLNQQRWSDHAAVAFLAGAPPKITVEQAVAQYARIRVWPRGGPVNDVSQVPADLLARYGLAPDGRKLETLQ